MSKPILAEKSIKLIDQVIACLKIPSNQQFYDQDVVAEDHGCGTVGCIAGWMYFIKKGKKKHDKMMESGRNVAMIDFAEDQMRYADGSKMGKEYFEPSLFGMVSHWEDEFADAYYEANSDAERAAAAIGKLEYFKKTGK
ncbi:MAG: hypothetical protein ACRYGG_12220 [Janthinobacterium lividum]